MGLFTSWLESLDYQFEILPSCTRNKSSRSTCQRCLDVCDEGAISIVKNIPVIEGNLCVECGRCLATCPIQAIAGIFPKRTVVQDSLLVTNKDLITPKELLLLYRNGVRTVVLDEPSNLEVISQNVVLANKMLEQLGEETISFKLDEKREKSYSRREVFLLFNKESKTLLKQIAPANWRLNHTQLDISKLYPNFQFANLTVDINKCTLCKACQVLCEKDCFNFTEREFSILPQACSACQLCVDICPEEAINLEEKISMATTIHFPVHQKKCNVCKQHFETLREQDEKCTNCTKREGYLFPT